MPGTIMVSVLEFLDLPLFSSTSIRASLGKIEYQVNDKGDLSFPLTSLRDDLIFKIQDAEGKEISRTGVQIKLILEKGVFEDNFPLGGGHLRLRLQFILSDEERDRIRSLRQSALKKKQDELLSSCQKGADTDSRTVTGNVALPFRRNDEVSESPKKDLQHEAVSRLEDPAGSSEGKESESRSVVGAQLEQKKQLNPNFSDQYKESSSTKPVSSVTLTQSQHNGKKPAYQSPFPNQSPTEKGSQRAIGSEEIAILFVSEKKDALTSSLLQPSLEEGGIQCSEKRTSLGRIPSNVKKMISAFEGGLAQDKRSQIKPPPTKHQESSRDSSKTQHLEQDKSKNTEPSDLHERVKSASQKATYVGSGSEGSKYEKIQETKESKPKTSGDNGDENSGGPFNQVVKVAIILGFGLLVLLTRQRRKSNGERQKDVFNFLNLPE
ncbi:hypothetical protein VNO78_03389 [Psophocarpus tetragonolobus]|uniref:Uncharacterized protein n=1 Tax=Psophocarpus tetragonolobus TaxID=3891 RepID=A0AAN9XWW6_PSOTE